MEFSKKSTHNSQKCVTGCTACWTGFSCQKCQGPCFFSRAAFKKNSKYIKEFKTKLKDKYYKEDFAHIRAYLLDHETVKDNLEETENVEELDEYGLLEMVHADPDVYGDALHNHETEYRNCRASKKIGMFLAASKIKGRCFYDRDVYDKFWKSCRRPVSKGVKNNNLLKEAKDFVVKVK